MTTAREMSSPSALRLVRGMRAPDAAGMVTRSGAWYDKDNIGQYSREEEEEGGSAGLEQGQGFTARCWRLEAGGGGSRRVEAGRGGVQASSSWRTTRSDLWQSRNASNVNMRVWILMNEQVQYPVSSQEMRK